jgi:hypothetical protein
MEDQFPYHDTANASRFLTEVMRHPIQSERLANLRTSGGGPTFEYFGRYPRYREDWLREWAMSRRSGPVRSTVEGQRHRQRLPRPAA